MTDEQLRQEIIRLGPWHHDMHVRNGITTRISEDVEYPGSLGRSTFVRAWSDFVGRMTNVYPNGLEGRSVLDYSCNCAECLFWAKELGAGRCFGSDVHEHWIKQAEFLLEHRDGPKEDIEVQVRDLYDLPELGLEPFDIVLSHGVFYHLPDPILGLKIAADLAKELLAVTTATAAGDPDGYLKAGRESTLAPLSGVYGLQWLPTGPEVMREILAWFGFPAMRVTYWRKKTRNNRGRLSLLAAREEAMFAHYDTTVGKTTTAAAEGRAREQEARSGRRRGRLALLRRR